MPLYLPGFPLALAYPLQVQRERIVVPPGHRVVFAGDMHATRDDPATLAQVLAFLDSLHGATDVESDGAAPVALVVLLGDLFEYWIGPSHRALGDHDELLAVLERLATRVPVVTLRGNRDFLMGADFARRGIRVVADWYQLTVESPDASAPLRCLITHGDLLCTRDPEYHRYRALVRSWPIEALARWLLPQWFVVRFARWLRRSSVRTKKTNRLVRRRLPEVFDITPEGVRGAFRRVPAATHLVCGHVHRLSTEPHPHPDPRQGVAKLHIAGAWANHGGGYIELVDGRFHLRRFEAATTTGGEGRGHEG